MSDANIIALAHVIAREKRSHKFPALKKAQFNMFMRCLTAELDKRR